MAARCLDGFASSPVDHMPSSPWIQETCSAYRQSQCQCHMNVLERDPHLEQLHDFARQATASGLLVFVGGEMGIGKTTLVEQFRREIDESRRIAGFNALSAARHHALVIATIHPSPLITGSTMLVPTSFMTPFCFGDIESWPVPGWRQDLDLHWMWVRSLHASRGLPQ